MKKIFTLSLALLMGLFFVTGVHQVEAAEAKLKMVTMLPAKHPVGKSFGGFIKRINAALKGEFQIDWRGGPEAVPQFKQPNAVRLGSVDATITSPSYVNGILNVSGASNYSNKTYAERKAAGFHDYFAKLHEAKGLVYVGELPMSNKSFHIFLRNPIKSLEDIKGLKIRVFPAIAPAVKALGANPVVLPMPAIYTSMERGVVKGFVTGIPGVAKIYKGVLGDWIHEGFYTAVFHFLVNPKSWAKIPAATRAKVLNYTRNIDPPIFEANWKPVIDAAYAAVEKAKLPGTKFSPAVTAKYSKTGYDAAWAAVKKKAPIVGAKLEKLLMK